MVKRLSGTVRRRPAFTLIEIMIGIIISAAAAMSLFAAHRAVTASTDRAAMMMLARSRGQRVINFIAPRALHCGFGLSAYRGTTGGLAAAFDSAADGFPVSSFLTADTHALRIYDGVSELWTLPPTEEDGAQAGAAFCLMYAVPTGIILGTEDGQPAYIEQGKTLNMRVLTEIPNNTKFISGRPRNLNSWCVAPSVGVPFLVQSMSASGRVMSLKLSDTAFDGAAIPPVIEICSLQCDRFRILEGVFVMQSLSDHWEPNHFMPREAGILSMWAEWRKDERLLDVWILADGGASRQAASGRPSSWPARAPWHEHFGERVLYVSRASWRLENF